MPSALWPVRSGLLSLFTSAFAASDTEVIDGPRKRGQTPRQYLVVGNELGEEPHARSVQQPSALAGGWRDELGEIDCTAVAWSGGDDLAALRLTVEGIVDACETAIAANPTLDGLLQPASNHLELTGLDIREARTDRGPFVEATFTVSYATVLTA